MQQSERSSVSQGDQLPRGDQQDASTPADQAQAASLRATGPLIARDGAQQQLMADHADQPSCSGRVREDDDGDVELAAFANRVLQRVQPGAELDAGSLHMLSLLLDQLTERVLDEAQRMSTAQAGVQPASGSSSKGGGGGKSAALLPLTSLDIHKAGHHVHRLLHDAGQFYFRSPLSLSPSPLS